MVLGIRRWLATRGILTALPMVIALLAAVTGWTLRAQTLTPSVDGTAIPPATQIVDNTGAVWTIGSNGAILRNGYQAVGGWGSKILWSNTTVYVYGTDGNWWRWTGTGWTNVGGTLPPGGTGVSADGTTVPATAWQIVDDAGAVWTIGSNGAILRNGIQAAGGWGTEILWSGGSIYVYGTDSNWWQWAGTGWIKLGATVPGATGVSPDGTMVPSVSQIIDSSGAIWTIGSNGAILRNGIQAGGGWGTKIFWSGGSIYVYGTDGSWWMWTGSGWTGVGSSLPSGGGTGTGGVSTDGTIVPTTASQIVDTGGAVWTISSTSAILQNGLQAAGGWGAKILWLGGTIYAYGTDSNWWQWTGSAWSTYGPTQPGSSGSSSGSGSVLLDDDFGGRQLFPPDNWWNQDISAAPVDPQSSAYINFIGATRGAHPDFGPSPYGIPYIGVPGTQSRVPVTFTAYGSESDTAINGISGYPIPDAAKTQAGLIEGGAPGGGTAGDRHLIVVDRDRWLLYELFGTQWNSSLNRWEAWSGAIFDMSTNDRRPEGWTSADAAGLAMLPGLVRYDEAIRGPIHHAFRVTVRSTNGYVWPASHEAGGTSGALPLGARLRLKPSKNLSGYPPYLQNIFRAMQVYGLIVADNGTDMYVSGTADARWNNSELNPAFSTLTAGDFEVIQLGWK